MREVPEPEHSEWVRRLRERARLDAEELVPRPFFGVLGLAAPVLRPAAIAAFQHVDGVWESLTLAYGDWEAAAGPLVTVTTAAVHADPEAVPDDAGARRTEEELLYAIDAERDRIAVHSGLDEDEPAGPPRYERSRLPCGEALVCRHGTVWAARLIPDASVAGAAGPGEVGEAGEGGVAGTGVSVTITGRGVDPESVLLEPAGDLRPSYEARNEILGRLAERLRNQPPPVLEPAEGIAAFRALADFALDSHEWTKGHGRARRNPRPRAGSGRLHGALWRRAVSEQQRIAGIGKNAADDVVTRVINHLNQLAKEAPWFADPRLRELAIEETLRYAMLGDDVPSKPAQQAWARYWRVRHERWQRSAEAPDVLADVQAGQPVVAAWRDAWAAWAARA